MTSFEIPRNTREYYLNELITLNMNAKMDSGSLSYQIRTCFITKTSLILHSRDCSHWFRIISCTSVQKFFPLKTAIILSYKIQSNDLHCKSVSWFLYGTSFYWRVFWKRPSGHAIFWRHRFFVGFLSRCRPITYWHWSNIVIWYLFPTS